MISRKCCTPFFWLAVVAINSVRCPLCQAKAETGGRQTRELTTIYPEMPQSDTATQQAQYPPSHACHRFSDPDLDKNEFYSPGFEGADYSPNIDCVLVLQAPPGKILKLDFRDYFQIEHTPDCKNDFLEVRDGPRGYNKLIKNRKFCGSEFPPILQSTDRYLWIHFKSDENIEYKGFRAVFEYVDRPQKGNPEVMACDIHLNDMEEGNLSKGNISAEYTNFIYKHKMNTDCIWIIVVREGLKIQLQFKTFELDKPNECDKNFVEVYSTTTDETNLKKKFCGSIADTVRSKSNVMYVRFFADFQTLNKSTFEANFTAYRELEKAQTGNKQGCRADEFDCEDATCISASLRCNGRFNCRFRWDEDDCQSAQSLSLNDDHIIVIMVIFSLILSGMCFTFIFNCVKKLVRDHKTIQEYIRQSREQQLNELDKPEPDKKMGKSASRSRSNSSPSTNSGHFDVANASTTPCYVPGGELLPILIRNERSMSPPNGDVYPNIYTVDNETAPEMCDSACQTRESLFTAQGYSSGNSTPNHSVHTNSPPAPFSTFGYKKETKFKAEAKIEVAPRRKPEDKRRPYSVQTTKSAPDVIVTH